MKTREINMTKGAIFPKLVAFSVPLVLSSVLQLFFNAADIIVVGRFAGENSLAAVGSTSSLINLLTNLFIGLSIGTNVVAANYFGANHKKNISHTVHTAMLLSIYSGVLLSVVGVFGVKYILRVMQAPEEVLTLATSYLQVYFAGITATMIYNFGSALLRAKGDTQRPLVILFLAGVINVILNLFFVIAWKLHVKGVALATVISQTVAAILIVRILATENDDFHLSFRDLSMNRDIFIRIIKIGIPAGFQGMMFSFSNVIIQSTINTFGSIVIAGNSAGINIEGFVYTSMNGFSQGTLTFCSQNLGSGNKERIKKAVMLSQVIVILVGIALGGAVVLFSHSLLSIFSSNEDVIQAGMLRLKFVCSAYALCGMMDCMGNAVRGIGHSMLPMVTTLLGACGLRILWIAALFQIPAYHSLKTIFFGYPLSWMVTWIVHTIAFVILFRRIKPVFQ